MPTEFRKKKIEENENIEVEEETEETYEEENPNNNDEEIPKKSTTFKFFLLFVFIALVIFVNFYLGYNKFKEKVLIENDLLIKIDVGDSFLNLGKKIPELDNMWYKIYIRENSPDSNLNAGMYKISGGSNIENIFKGLEKPVTDEINITILEGRNIFDIDKHLSSQGLINSREYINYVRNKEKITALSEFFPFIKNQITLEGFLYPDTYKININNFKINEFVIKQLETFETKVYNKILKSYDVDTITDVVNLASIVENEEQNPEEKATVAGILKKRLNSSWMIGADITVCYAHEITSKECSGTFIKEHVNEKNDYNTRTMTGLPKTPIGNPNFETINATLNDKKTDYRYYLHNVNTGKIYYAKTNAEHEANKQYMY